MKAKFICHKDFENLKPVNVFQKENLGPINFTHPKELLNRHTLFRRSFFADNVENATIKITADDYFKLYINGKFVMQGPPPSYPNAYFYIEKDVSKFLKKGKNVIAVITYYQGLINRVWVSGDLRSMLYLDLKANGKTILVSDENFKVSTHTGYENVGITGYDTQVLEGYNSNAKEIDFYKSNFNDKNWENACVYKNADYKLIKSPIEPIAIYKQPFKTKMVNNGVMFLDFGYESAGTLTITAKGNKGDEITIYYGEELENGRVKHDMRCNCNYVDKWWLSGKKDKLIQFDYKAFRYAEIIIPNGVEILSVFKNVRHYPFKNQSKFKTKNQKLKQVLNLCRNTVKYGAQEVFVDCPTREKGQYLGDLCVSGRAHAVLTKSTTLIKKCFKDFCNSSFICKGLMAVSTSSFNQEIADYSLLTSALALWIYNQDGDVEFLNYAYPYLKNQLNYFKAYLNKAFLLEGVGEKWNMVDWPENLRDNYSFPITRPIGKGVHNVINAHFIGFLKAFDKISQILGKKSSGLTKKAENSFITAFLNKQTNLFTDGADKTHSSVHSNVLPLLFEIGTNDKKVKQSIINFICDKKLTSMGVYMSYFALAGLVKAGKTRLAVELATDENAWLNMIKEGATTTFEAWGKDQKWNTSLFHPWATAPTIIFENPKNVY